MKSSLRLSLSCLAISLSAGALPGAQLPESGWRFQQEFEISKPGLVKIPVPIETLDHAAADLHDLRVANETQQEIPFALIRPTASAAHWEDVARYDVSLVEGATVVTIETGGDRAWEAADLVTRSPRFMKAARVEASNDRKNWETWSSGLPLFRQDGAQETTLPLRREKAERIRITLEDTNQSRLVITGVRLRAPDQQDATFATLPVVVEHSEDGPTESILTLRLPAANLDLDALELDIADELFTRGVQLGLREVRGEQIEERIAAEDTVYRISPDGTSRGEKRIVSLSGVRLPSREILLHIDNGDSPPLKIQGVRAIEKRAFIAFTVGTPGKFSLWSGNPQASIPRYDLANLASRLRGIAEIDPAFSAAKANPLYQQLDPLAGISTEGSPIDAPKWSRRRAVQIKGAGVQALELDLPALSALDPSLRDLRLVRAGKQIPYLVEHTNILRAIEVQPKVEAVSDKPRETFWKLQLAHSGLPITQVSLQTSKALFDREIEIYEDKETSNGATYRVPLGNVRWQRNLNDSGGLILLPLQRPSGSVLTIHTENGDNPPIPIERVRLFYPVTRLLFRADTSEPIDLLSGNENADTPRYDIALVADALLRSEKQVATLAPDAGSETAKTAPVLSKSVLLWAALALVVVGLLFVVAKLLPKQPK